MKLSRYILSAIFAMMAGIGIVKIVMGELSPLASIFCIGYLCMIASLNSKGGKAALVVSYLFSGVLSLLLLGVLAAVAMPLFGQNFMLELFLPSLIIGGIGALTVFTLIKMNAKSI